MTEPHEPTESDLAPGRFFLPGPTEVRESILEAQARPVIGHRGPEIKALMAELQEGLREVFQTRRPVLISTSSATGFMEAGIRNAARSRVLSLVNGAFSQRFAEIGSACGFEVDVLEVEWGRGHDPDQVADRLATGRYDTVTVVHSETSTGVLNPLRELAAVVAEAPDAVLLVDSVTGVGGAEVRTDEWALDYVLTGSQKAMALPPGLAFAVASDRILARSDVAERKGVYFDLRQFAAQLEKSQTPNTPAVTLLYALRAQLQRIRDEGMDMRWARHLAMRDRCVDWVRSLREDDGIPVQVLAPAGLRSPTVTCIELPSGVAGPEVVGAMAARGFVIGGGYGKLKPTHVRIGHMGDHTLEELDLVLAHLREVLVQ
jgi:predicted phosphoserine aminotransferase